MKEQDMISRVEKDVIVLDALENSNEQIKYLVGELTDLKRGRTQYTTATAISMNEKAINILKKETCQD